jgi:hypothetical protein
MSDYGWIGPLVGAVGKGVNSFATADRANSEIQEAYRQMLANLQARMGDYDGLGKAGYSDLVAQTLGPSALEGIQDDPAARQAQLEALATLADLIDRGGLSLGDQTALNRIEGTLNQNDVARRKGLANEFAARGQLGAGAQLGMSLDAQQSAAQNANTRAEGIAGQAQDRAMQAILEKGRMSGSMSDRDYARKANAARARDAIEARNAAARTDAGKYNNSLRGQAFEDELAKARGKTALAGDMNSAVFGSGRQSANTTLGRGSATNELIDGGTSAWRSMAQNSDDGDSDTDIADYDSDHGDGFEDDE